jgi:hypothetical protein
MSDRERQAWLKDALEGGEITQEQYDANQAGKRWQKLAQEWLSMNKKENDVLGGAPSEEELRIICRKCGEPIQREQSRFGSSDTGWEHMPGGCPELRTKTGKVLTDADVDKLSEEADMGYTSVEGNVVPVQKILLDTTDARVWAEHFVAQFGDSEADEPTMITWFANAIEVGRSQGLKELCPHNNVSRLGQDLWACTNCGKLTEGDNWPDNSPPLAGEEATVEIGGQRMTQAQFDAARFPLLNPDPGLASEEEVQEFVEDGFDTYPPQPLATQEWVERRLTEVTQRIYKWAEKTMPTKATEEPSVRPPASDWIEHRLSEVRNHLVVVTKAEIDKQIADMAERITTLEDRHQVEWRAVDLLMQRVETLESLPLVTQEWVTERLKDWGQVQITLRQRVQGLEKTYLHEMGDVRATIGEVRQWSKDLAVKVEKLEQRGSNAHIGTIMQTGYKNEAEIRALTTTLDEVRQRLTVLEQDRDKLLRPEARNTIPRHPGSYFDEGEGPSIQHADPEARVRLSGHLTATENLDLAEEQLTKRRAVFPQRTVEYVGGMEEWLRPRRSVDAPSDTSWPGQWSAGWNAAVQAWQQIHFDAEAKADLDERRRKGVFDSPGPDLP